MTEAELLDRPFGVVKGPHGGHTESFFCRYCGHEAPAPWAITHPPTCEIRLDPRFPPTRITEFDPECVIDPLAHPPGESFP